MKCTNESVLNRVDCPTYGMLYYTLTKRAPKRERTSRWVGSINGPGCIMYVLLLGIESRRPITVLRTQTVAVAQHKQPYAVDAALRHITRAGGIEV
jgi:hypothetical protein